MPRRLFAFPRPLSLEALALQCDLIGRRPRARRVNIVLTVFSCRGSCGVGPLLRPIGRHRAMPRRVNNFGWCGLDPQTRRTFCSPAGDGWFPRLEHLSDPD